MTAVEDATTQHQDTLLAKDVAALIDHQRAKGSLSNKKTR